MDQYNLLNKNAIKILETFKSDKKIYFSQIYERSGIKSKNNLIKNLNVMVYFNVLKKEIGKGNTFYSINYENRTTLALVQIINMMKFAKLPFERRKAIGEVIDLTKPGLAILFGSTAKGDFKKDSDIDLLLVYDLTKKITKEISGIGSRFGIRISPTIITFEQLENKNDALIHVLKTGYPITGENYFYNEFKKI